MAKVMVLDNPRRKRRSRRRNSTAKAAPARRTNPRRRRTSARRRRRNPTYNMATVNPTRVNRRRRRRNPFGLKLGGMTSGFLGHVALMTAGFYGTKALDYFNRTWTMAASSNPATREIIKDAAATTIAMLAPWALKLTGLINKSMADQLSMGGVLYAINRGITARGAANTSYADGSFQKHLLSDYDTDMGDFLLDDGSSNFGNDFFGVSDYDDDLGDFLLDDGGYAGEG